MDNKRLFGIIGYPLTHSFSERYFNNKFATEGIIDAGFKAFSIEHIQSLPSIIQSHTNLQGFAITIPHKKAVLSYLQQASTTVQQMGACNCVRIKDGILIGHNTDVLGFENSFVKHVQPHHNKALVLGSGGAAAAVEFVLAKLGISYKVVSRNINEAKDNYLTYQEITEAVMDEYNVIINSTPLGTYPKVEEAPPIPYHLLTTKHYLFDLVYNPAETTFLRLGKERGAIVENGYEMLVLQAEENWNIWNDLL